MVEAAALKQISMKEAVDRAKDYAAELYADERVDSLGLEGARKSDDGARWLITLGFARPWDLVQRRRTDLFTQEQEIVPARVFKTFAIDAESGEIVEVKAA